MIGFVADPNHEFAVNPFLDLSMKVNAFARAEEGLRGQLSPVRDQIQFLRRALDGDSLPSAQVLGEFSTQVGTYVTSHTSYRPGAMIVTELVHLNPTAKQLMQASDRVLSCSRSGGSYRAAWRGFVAMRAPAEMPNAPVKSQLYGEGVFLAHGRNVLWQKVSLFLQDKGYDVHTFERHRKSGGQVIPTLQEMTAESCFGVIVATAEDESVDGLRQRQNVVHETGLCQGCYGWERVAILRQSNAAEYSNLKGLLFIEFTEDQIDSTYHDLLEHLQRAEVPIGQ